VDNYFDHPSLVFVTCLIALWVAAWVGDHLRKSRWSAVGDGHEFDTVKTASLTLLALIVGFAFAMAISRYEQRKTCEEEEANAIGTEYLRLDLLPADERGLAKDALKQYLRQRILFYSGTPQTGADRTEADQLQSRLWGAASRMAFAQPTPIAALVVTGANAVFNSQGYTQAAWSNRIPVSAWLLMGLIAISCNLLVGYGEARKGGLPLTILPLVVSISFFLIADIDSPRCGLIHIRSENLALTVVTMR
jgi:hypothetical protein